jgi:hypothetical protein
MIIWFANFVLILCYILLGHNRFRAGWAASVTGNLIYVAMMLRMHRFDLAFLPATFTILAGWNLWVLVKRQKSTN